MQKLLYPYLPEGMRNPQTFEWMMSNPEYRTQLEQMMEKQVSFADQHHQKRMKGEKNESPTQKSGVAVLGDSRGPPADHSQHHHSANTKQSHCLTCVDSASCACTPFCLLRLCVVFVLLKPRLYLLVFLQIQSSSLPNVTQANISMPLPMQSAAYPSVCNKACDLHIPVWQRESPLQSVWGFCAGRL